MSTTGEFSNDSDRMATLVGSGATRRYLDDGLHPGLNDKLLIYKEHEIRHKIVHAGRHGLLETATGTVCGEVADMNGNKQRVDLAYLGWDNICSQYHKTLRPG